MATTAISEEIKRLVVQRLEDARLRMVFRNPFYGNLILHLKFSLANIGTAGTNMKRIIFDPEFIMRLTDSEIDFVLKHEIMHCCLQHCIRGKGKNQYFYNIACDIVVNSNIMQSMGVSTFTVDGEEAMHLTPDKREGFLFSAEEVYDMLMAKYETLIRDVDEVLKEIKRDYGVNIDNHEIWNTVPLDDSLSDVWKIHLKAAAIKEGKNGECPPSARKMLEDLDHESKLNWKAVLHDFIKEINDKHDFSFTPPDRRFSAGDCILPSFTEAHSESVDNLWFLIDTSGSISIEELTSAYAEVKSAIEQFDYLSGKLSFFDTRVSEPKDFDSVDSLKEIEPVGGGGTSFHCIFEYMRDYFKESLPTAVIILTDGYAAYPDEDVAMGVPVLWVIAGDNEENLPWGVTIHI